MNYWFKLLSLALITLLLACSSEETQKSQAATAVVEGLDQHVTFHLDGKAVEPVKARASIVRVGEYYKLLASSNQPSFGLNVTLYAKDSLFANPLPMGETDNFEKIVLINSIKYFELDPNDKTKIYSSDSCRPQPNVNMKVESIDYVKKLISLSFEVQLCNFSPKESDEKIIKNGSMQHISFRYPQQGTNE